MANVENKFSTHLNTDVIYKVKKDGYFDKKDIVEIVQENQTINATEMVPYESGFTYEEVNHDLIAPKIITLSDYILPSKHYVVQDDEKEALLYPIRNDTKQKTLEKENFIKDSNIKIYDKIAYNFTNSEKITFGEEKKSKENNYVTQGDVNISEDGIFSGTLNSSNYIAFDFENTQLSTFEITSSFSFDTFSSYNAILDLNNNALFLGITSNKFQLFVGSIGTNWNIASGVFGSTILQTNTKYWIKCGKSESTYYVKLSTDGKSYTDEIIVNSTITLAYFNKLTIGCYTKDSNWSFNGTYYFSNLTVSKNNKPADYLYITINEPYEKVGDIIVTNNVAYGFSSTSYIRIKNLDLDTTKPWQFSTEITATTSSSGMRIIGSAYTNDIPAGLVLGLAETGEFHLWLSSDGVTWNICNGLISSNVIELNTPYNINIKYTGGTYIVEAKKITEEEFTNFITINSSTPISHTIDFDLGISAAAYALAGSMNLKNTTFYNADEIIWNGNIETYYIDNVIMVGNVNITNKIASNFSNSNYLIIPAPTETVTSYEIVTKFKTSSFDNARVFGNSTTNIHSPQLEVPNTSNNENIGYYHPNSNYSWTEVASNVAIEKDTWYWIKIVYSENTVTVYQHGENEAWFEIGTAQADGCGWDQDIYVGQDQGSFILNGEVDLLETYVKINNKDFYSFYTAYQNSVKVNKADLTGKFAVFNPAYNTSSQIASSGDFNLCYNYYNTQQFATYQLSTEIRYLGKTYIKPGKKYWYKCIWENGKYSLYSMEDNNEFTIDTLPDITANGIQLWENPRFRDNSTLELDDVIYTIEASHSDETTNSGKIKAFDYDITTSENCWWTKHGDTSTNPCWISFNSTKPICPTEIILMNEIASPTSPKDVEIRGINNNDEDYTVLATVTVESNTAGLLTNIPIDTTTFFKKIQVYCLSSYSTEGVSIQEIYIKGKIDKNYWTKELEFDCENCPIDIYNILLGNSQATNQPLQGFIYLKDTKLIYNDTTVIRPYQTEIQNYIEDKYTIKEYNKKKQEQILTNLNYQSSVYWYQKLPNVFENTTQTAEMGFSFKPKTASDFTLNSGILQMYAPTPSNNYSTYGTVTIDSTNKIATFTNNSFLYTNNQFNVSNGRNWELKLKLKHTTPNTLQEFYRSTENASYKGFILAISEENKLKIWANNDSNVSNWNLADGISGEFEIPVDTWLWIRVYFDGVKYAVTYSLDNNTYYEDITLYSYNPLSYYSQNMRLGSGQNSYFHGEIDLKEVVIPISNYSYWYPIQKLQIDANVNSFRVWTQGGNINTLLRLNNTDIINTSRAIFNEEKTYIKLYYDNSSATPWKVFMGYSPDEMTQIGSSTDTNIFTSIFETLRIQFGKDYILNYTGMNGEIDIADFYLKENDNIIKLKTQPTDSADVNFIQGTAWAYLGDNYKNIQLTGNCIINNQNILSNFSANNYARIPNVLTFGANDYEIVIKYKFNNFALDYTCLFGVFEDVAYRIPKIQYYRPNNSILFYIENTSGDGWQNGTGVAIPGLIPEKNVWLYFMVKKVGGIYYFKTSGDNKNWITWHIFQYKSIPYTNTSYHMALGTSNVNTSSHEWLDCEIDLNESYIKIGDNIAWKYTFNDIETNKETLPGLLTEDLEGESTIILNAYACIDDKNIIHTILSKTKPDTSLYAQVILIKENIEIQKGELKYKYNKEKEEFEIEEYRELSFDIIPPYATVSFKEVTDENQ